MIYLVFVTILWAFSFSLIGVYLAGAVDPYFSVWIRVALALSIFLPFLKRKGTPWSTIGVFTGIGAVQLGLMYIFYYNSFLLLTVPEVLVFTILTPLYVTLIDDAFAKKWNGIHLGSALIAIGGAAIIRANPINSDFLTGFLVVQGANICFAFGQVAYKRHKQTEGSNLSPLNSFAWFYLGAFLVASITYLVLGSPKLPSEGTQWLVLIWLGVGASGLGYFLWNYGATKVNAGVLAAMNNALIPAGILVNLLIWEGSPNLLRLGAGSALILFALWLSLRKRHVTVS
ncbi:MAG: EamA family transporter [Opitutales bacterium]